MNFYRRPVFFFALFAVCALVVPYTAADEVQTGLDKLGEDIKKSLEAFQKTAKEQYEKLPEDTKKSLASGLKTIQDTAQTIQDKTAEAVKNAKLDEHVKSFQDQAGKLYENAKANFEKKD